MTAPHVSSAARVRAIFCTGALALAALSACGPDRTGFGDATVTDAARDGVTPTVDGALEAGFPPGDGGTDVPPIPVDGTSMGGMDMTIVYAHSGRELYAFDPRRSPPTVTLVGTFAAPTAPMNLRMPSFTDIAVDKNGVVVGVTRDALFRINPSTAECTLISMLPAGSSLYVALSYIPDGDTEYLVGGTQDGVLYEINPTTGAAMRRSQLSGSWKISGDFVSVVGAGTYVTVRENSNDNDTLALVNIDTGRVTPVNTRGDTGFKNIFGLGYWRATVFGFNRDGDFLRIDTTTGRATKVTLPSGMMIESFAGAGSTTIAPTGPG